MKGRILVVDDDPVALHMLEEALHFGGFEVVRAYGAADALSRVRLQRPDVVLTERLVQALNEFLREARSAPVAPKTADGQVAKLHLVRA